MFNNDEFGGSAIWLVIFVLFFAFGGNGWGNGNQVATNADLQRGFDTQNVTTRLDTIGQNLTNATYENAQLINNASMNNMQSIFGLTNAMTSGFDSVNSNINNLSHQLSDCCCALKTQMLQDKYDAAQNQLNLAEIASANAVQTQNILGNLGRWYANPPFPYYANGYYGGTTIA